MFSHNTAGGMFSSTEEALSKNPDNPEAPLYSILSKLESYRNADGSFHFKICYPEKMAAKLGHCNEWIQTSNPVTEGNIKGFKKIYLAFPKNGGGRDWVGIGKTGKSGPSLIDDTASAASWWMAIGATGNNPAGSKNIPGPWLNNVKKVELYVKDNFVKVFSHSTAAGVFASIEDALNRNSDNPEAPLFSILGQLESYRNAEGNFHLKLCYPERKKPKLGHCNEWLQSSNPAIEGKIAGYRKIHLAFLKNGAGRPWGGLGRSGRSGSALMDDTGSQPNWWMAVGATNYYGAKTVPGPWGLPLVKKIELYVNPTSSGAGEIVYTLCLLLSSGTL